MAKQIKTKIEGEDFSQYAPHILLEKDPRGVVFGLNGHAPELVNMIVTCMRRSPGFDEIIRAAVRSADVMALTDKNLKPKIDEKNN